MNLQRFVDDIVERLRSKHFVDGALNRVLGDGLCRQHACVWPCYIDVCQSRIEQACCAIDHTFKHKCPRVHARKLLLNQWERGNLASKLLAFIRVMSRQFDSILRSANSTRSQLETSDIQNVERDLVA